MAPTLSLRISDFTVAATGNVARPTPQGPMAFRPGGRDAAVNLYDLTLGPFLGSSASHDGTRRSQVSAARVDGSVSAAEIADE